LAYTGSTDTHWAKKNQKMALREQSIRNALSRRTAMTALKVIAVDSIFSGLVSLMYMKFMTNAHASIRAPNTNRSRIEYADTIIQPRTGPKTIPTFHATLRAL
jgi:hypothetical protein